MDTYDLLDEAELVATPAQIIDALTDEAAGRSHWWEPWARIRARGDQPITEVGAVLDIAVNPNGRIDRPWDTARFASRVLETEPGRRVLMEYFEGAFRGTTEWTLPTGRRPTHPRGRAVDHPTPRADAAARPHHRPARRTLPVIQQGLRGIERHVQQRTRSPA